jgi:nitrogen fixation NifU-like protein
MSLDDLYQEVILDHHKAPRNFGVLQAPTGRARGDNPLCGDKIQVTLEVQGRRIAQIAFEGSGCAISKASASMMTEAVRGKTVEEVEALFEDFHRLVTSPEEDAELAVAAERLGKLRAFGGVREFPVRVKCASLAWHTLRAALAGDRGLVSTE